MTQLSANFSLAEMTFSQTAVRHRISNAPSGAELDNLTRLCKTVLQPLRDFLKKPIKVSSGYRAPALNRAVGGSLSSAHMYGRAADISVEGMSAAQLFNTIKGLKLPVDQCIDEFGSWVHVGIATAGQQPRHQYLRARHVAGQTVYLEAR